ncbi:hypothetical protein [Streptomyces sp. NPDC001843]|uniref:hypothetical protein n=1 Tax=Streptomyces sp. NPDC001843 TaxID=3364617 RepID=UPI0036AE0387
MTSPTTRVAPAARTRVRVAAVTVGLAGALALTACGGGGGSDDASTSPSPAGSSAGASTADTGAGTGGVTGASGGLQGSWLATHDGKAVALVVTGKKAALFVTGGTVCSGTAGEEAGMQMLHLSCADGGKDRTTGMVDSVGKSSLTITWSGKLGKETYTKAEGGKLPSGLATASIGTP